MQRPSWSRRRFLGAVAAAPAMTYVARASAAPHVAVVGAGAFGMWTADQLHRQGARVTLIDAYGPGSPRASSGGDSRVIRAVYGPDRIYVDMVKRSFELWEELAALTTRDLYTETGALWMHRGGDDYLRSALPFMRAAGFPLEPVDLDDARRRWPQISFDGVRSVWLEHRAGALAARDCVRFMHQLRQQQGGDYLRLRARPGPIRSGVMTRLLLDDGTQLEADAYVFACGPWLSKLFPDVMGQFIRPTRQEVHYFGPPPGNRSFGAGSMPTWIDFGPRIFYGLPDLQARGFKIADDTRGELFDPDRGNRMPSAEGVQRARELIAQRFPALSDAPLLDARVCQYENSPDGHLIIDRHPNASNAWLVGGGSGHGFKLSPAVGQRVASHLLDRQPIEPQFALTRFVGATGRGTQFESGGNGA